MKRNIFVAAFMGCMGLCAFTQAVAANWRVNYDYRAKADFRDINAAMSDERVQDGDTLYLDKGTRLTSPQTISKSVTVIGPGYFIGENDADEAYLSSNLYITAEEVKITGLHTSDIYIRANKDVVERCRVTGTIYGHENFENDNVSIHSSFITGCIYGKGDGGSFSWEIANNIIRSGVRFFREALITHNIIQRENEYTIEDVISSTISNNIIWNHWVHSYYGSHYYDRIYSSTSDDVISHNYSHYSQDYNLFTREGEDGQYDYYYQLAEESPAKGYAEDGGDCGPWDGPYPYVLSGYPLHVPRFESINVPSKPENGKLTVTLKIKNQNE